MNPAQAVRRSPDSEERIASAQAPRGALDGLRVLDAAGPMGSYCGKLLADMGADVVLVEPVGGGILRREPPFIADAQGPEHGIAFTYFNTSKRAITLNLDAPKGQDLLRRLAVDSHVLIETEMPGTMAQRRLAPADLWRISPGLVVTSITPFGQTGPYSRFEGEDLVALAMGGLLNISGYPDTAPTRIHGNQAFHAASLFAAVATMVAVLAAEAGEAAEHVDVSVQEAVAMALENTVQYYDLEGRVRARAGLTQRYTGAGLYPCRDGYVYVFVGGLAAIGFWDGFVSWMVEARAPGADRLLGPQWHERSYRETEEARRVFAEVFGQFASTRGRMDLYYEAQQRRIPLSPVSTPADVANNRQLLARGFFTAVQHPATGRTIHMPGAPYRLSRTPWRVQRPAPGIGEHNIEVFSEIGVSPDELAALEREGVV